MSKGSNTPEKIKCLKCHKEKVSTTSFYINANPLFSSDRFVVCKECFNEFIGTKGSIGYLGRVKQVLSLLNKPFLIDIWSSRDEDFSKYIPHISSFPQYKGLTYQDSTAESSKQSTTTDTKQSNYTDEEFTELQAFWGKNYHNEELEYLQREYEKFINSYECDSYAMELLFQEAAQQRLSIKRLRQESKSVDKELRTLQDLLGSANIKPAQESGANATEQATFGTLIKKYENERPIPEPDPAWQDVDGIKKYIQVWFLGHLCKMIGINNDYSKMYEEELAKHTVESPTYQDEEDETGDLK